MHRLIYHTDKNLPLQSALVICLVFSLKCSIMWIMVTILKIDKGINITLTQWVVIATNILVLLIASLLR